MSQKYVEPIITTDEMKLFVEWVGLGYSNICNSKRKQCYIYSEKNDLRM